MLEEDGAAREVPRESAPEMGAALPLLLEVAVVIVEDVDRFRALGGMSDSLGAGSCSLSNLPIAGFCTTLENPFLAMAPSQGRKQYLMPPDSLAHLIRKPIENLLVVLGDEPRQEPANIVQ